MSDDFVFLFESLIQFLNVRKLMKHFQLVKLMYLLVLECLRLTLHSVLLIFVGFSQKSRNIQ